MNFVEQIPSPVLSCSCVRSSAPGRLPAGPSSKLSKRPSVDTLRHAYAPGTSKVMKKLPPLCALILLSCLTASAQQAAGNGYRFDNFDVPGGVRIEQPAPLAPATRPRRALKLTAKTSARPAAAEAGTSKAAAAP